MKKTIKVSLYSLALTAFTVSILGASALTAFAADEPPSIDFSFNDSGNTPADSSNDAPPSLGTPPSDSTTPPPENTTPPPTTNTNTGNTSGNTTSTYKIAGTGPEILGLIPASLILGYAVSRRRK